MLLAGDVGGTKTNLAVFPRGASVRAPVAKASLPSAAYPDLGTLVKQFLLDKGLTVRHACLAVAGPVVSGHASITNLGWDLDAASLGSTLGVKSLTLLNDLEAIGYGIPQLRAGELFTLHEGRPIQRGTLSLIAPGTGLGECFLTWDGTRYRAYPTEGGHSDFAPANAQQIGLLSFLLRRYDHVSVERVCSGLGIPNIYAYLREAGPDREPEFLAKELAAASDPTPVIVGHGMHPDSSVPICAETVRMFVDILGAEAGNQALKVMATGGVYLGGGIPPKMLPALQADGRFLHALRAKGRLTALLERMPVRVILNPETALMGAAVEGWERAHD